MHQQAAESEELRAAWEQVGKFLYHFSLLEQKIDDGIGRLLGLGGGSLAIVTANLDFVRKVHILRSAEVFKAANPCQERKKLLSSTFNGILALNDKRKIVAHCTFSPGQKNGVLFRRVVATTRLTVEDVQWQGSDFENHCSEADGLRNQLDQIIADMVPYEPKLDFSDPRNSMYLAIF